MSTLTEDDRKRLRRIAWRLEARAVAEGWAAEEPLADHHFLRSLAEESPQGEKPPCETCGGDEEIEVTVGVGNDRIPERKPCPDCGQKPEEGDPGRHAAEWQVAAEREALKVEEAGREFDSSAEECDDMAAEAKPSPPTQRKAPSMATEMKKDWAAEWRERCAARYLESVKRGEHDEECEYDPQGFYLCHCSKRRREAAGHTELPTDDLDFPPPDCPRCDQGLVHDEGWYCSACSLSWDSRGHGDSASFTDVHGDDLAAQAEQWRATQAAYRASKEKGASDA